MLPLRATRFSDPAPIAVGRTPAGGAPCSPEDRARFCGRQDGDVRESSNAFETRSVDRKRPASQNGRHGGGAQAAREDSGGIWGRDRRAEAIVFEAARASAARVGASGEALSRGAVLPAGVSG